MRVVLGPFSVNPQNDQAIVDAFENLPPDMSKSAFFRLAMHHWLESNSHQGASAPVDKLDAIDSKLSMILDRLSDSSIVVESQEIAGQDDIDPRVEKIKLALGNLGDL